MEKETVDTSVLSSVKMSKEEALSLLSKEQVLTGRNKRGEDRCLNDEEHRTGGYYRLTEDQHSSPSTAMLRKKMKNEKGVGIITQPLSSIINEKRNNISQL